MTQHNLRFEPSKMALIGFSQKRKADPMCPRRLAPETRPNFHLRNVVIKPSATRLGSKRHWEGVGAAGGHLEWPIEAAATSPSTWA